MHTAFDSIDFNWWYMTLSEYVLYPSIMIILCLLSVFVVLGNLLVVSAIWHEHQLHSVTNYLIASLAAADCLVGAVVMPFSIISEIIIGSWTFGEAWCDLWHSFDVLASTASIMNLCAISLDRYLAITDPISYPSRMTPKRVALLIVSLWTCSSLISFPAILWWRAVGQEPLQQFEPTTTTISPFDISSTPASSTAIDELKVPQFKCVFPDDPYYLLFSSFISFYGPLCVMLYAYYRIYKAAVQQTRFLKYGSKQVMIGRNKRKKRSRHVSEHSSIGVSEKNKFNDETCDGLSNMQSYDKQHLVLRVHRGGGGGNSLKSSNSDTANVKGSIERKKKENPNSELATLHRSNQRTKDDGKGGVSPKIIVLSDLHDHSEENCPQQLLKQQTTHSFDSGHRERSELANRNNAGSSLRDKLRVDSQRFESKQLPNTLILSDDCSCSNTEIKNSDTNVMNSHLNDTSIEFADKVRFEGDGCRRNEVNQQHFKYSKQSKQNCAKPLLAFINNRSTSIDVSVINHLESIETRCLDRTKILIASPKHDKKLASQTRYSAHRNQKDSSFIKIEEKEDDNDDQFQDTNSCENNVDSESEDMFEELAGSLSSSSGSYGTGSIASVMVKPETFVESYDEKLPNRKSNNPNHRQLIGTKLKRAFSYGETNNFVLNTVSRVDEFDNEEVSSPHQVPNQTQSKQSNKLHRASCGDPSFQITSSAFGGYGSKAVKTLNIRSWVKLTKARNSSKQNEGNQTEKLPIKPPPSLMPLMMMNSDTSTDSSTVSSVIKRANRKRDTMNADVDMVRVEIRMSEGRENHNTDEQHPDDGILKTHIAMESKPEKETDNHADKNLTFKEDLESGEGCSSTNGSKGQMLYYNSEKLMQSIVDLNAIRYIDCANHIPKNHDAKDNDCGDENRNVVEKLDMDLSGQVQPLGSGRSSNMSRNRGVGKKLSKLAKERKAAKTLGIVVGVFILCWLPFFVVNIVVALCGTNCIYKLQIFVPIVTWLGWLNSAMNPVIYACWSRDFRRAFRRVLCSWVEFICPYDGAYLARKLNLKKSSNYSTQEAYLNRTASSIKGNTSSATVRSVGVSMEGRTHNSTNGKGTRSLLSDQ